MSGSQFLSLGSQLLGKRIEDVICTDLKRGFLRIVFDDDTTLDITAPGDYGYDATLVTRLVEIGAGERDGD